MPTDISIRVIYLGLRSDLDLDPDETVPGAEAAGDLVGTTFGSVEAPLFRDINDVVLHDGDDDGAIAFDNASGPAAGEHAVHQGAVYHLDSGVIYSGTVTYADGSTATGVALRVLQATDGTLALAPPPAGAANGEIAGLTGLPIRSITLTGVIDPDRNEFDLAGYGDADAPAFVCFCQDTLILTERGQVAVQDLRVGDTVITRDHGPQPLRWIGRKHLAPDLLGLFATLRPVRIRAGALGPGLPRRDLYVSQQHRVLVASQIARRMFGEPEVLVAAKHLTGIEGIEIVDSARPLTYYHLLFDRHEIIWSEGAQTESLFTGAQALKSLDPAARAEIAALFPQLAAGHPPRPARPLGKGRETRRLASRHAANRRALQSAVAR